MKKTPKTKDKKHMNKATLIASIAEASNLSKSDSARALSAMLDFIRKGLKEDNTVRLQEFGVFTIRQLPARTVRNPRTGKPLKVPASKFPKFKPSMKFKAAIA
jgi:DNA-binding protein HU-beta